MLSLSEGGAAKGSRARGQPAQAAGEEEIRGHQAELTGRGPKEGRQLRQGTEPAQ
ncbi:hypothetical protein chiPu_0027650, partial [Chiloscyllium punctatum]|nr:hypothetical protein [Chiloscyllium punctatum]